MMGGLTSITDTFGDGLHTFVLPFAQLEELQERTGVGPAVLLGRLVDGTWRAVELRETIRLALIGGGLPAVQALKLVQRYVDGQPLDSGVTVAVGILLATLRGRRRPDGEAAGEPVPARSATGPDGSISPVSDAPPPSSESAPSN